MPGTEKVLARYRTSGFSDTDRGAVDEGYGALLRWLPADRAARILDLGCGGGEFLDFLRRAHYVRAEGIDVSPEQVERCRARGLERVGQSSDSRAFLRAHPRAFDAVVMNDVLEHIPKAQCIDTLEDIRGALVKGGTLLVKVPNAANVFGLVARYLDFTHEIAFTEHSLRQVLLAAGYADVEVGGLNVALEMRPKRVVYWLLNRAYVTVHRAAYIAAVGSDAPTILSKLLVARGTAR
ncbi:MAG TPA: class I SAM-dependent methyltransferase [Polyangiaceae bacterium]|nr:class I SAM-dependent methyltransferase [Polyangiaceae bacterium]